MWSSYSSEEHAVLDTVEVSLEAEWDLLLGNHDQSMSASTLKPGELQLIADACRHQFKDEPSKLKGHEQLYKRLTGFQTFSEADVELRKQALKVIQCVKATNYYLHLPFLGMIAVIRSLDHYLSFTKLQRMLGTGCHLCLPCARLLLSNISFVICLTQRHQSLDVAKTSALLAVCKPA